MNFSPIDFPYVPFRYGDALEYKVNKNSERWNSFKKNMARTFSHIHANCNNFIPFLTEHYIKLWNVQIYRGE